MQWSCKEVGVNGSCSAENTEISAKFRTLTPQRLDLPFPDFLLCSCWYTRMFSTVRFYQVDHAVNSTLLYFRENELDSGWFTQRAESISLRKGRRSLPGEQHHASPPEILLQTGSARRRPLLLHSLHDQLQVNQHEKPEPSGDYWGQGFTCKNVFWRNPRQRQYGPEVGKCEQTKNNPNHHKMRSTCIIREILRTKDKLQKTFLGSPKFAPPA